MAPEPIGRVRPGFDEGIRAGGTPTAHGGLFGRSTEDPPFVVPEGAPPAL
ncbi:hypothetical protein AB0H42_24445 [Nocardia sp. NPDC050799]